MDHWASERTAYVGKMAVSDVRRKVQQVSAAVDRDGGPLILTNEGGPSGPSGGLDLPPIYDQASI